MTTTVGKENGTRIVVENGVEHFHSRNQFYEIFVRGGPTSGEVWCQMRIGNFILPIPLAIARDVTRVDKENPKGHMWDSQSEYLDITWSPNQ